MEEDILLFFINGSKVCSYIDGTAIIIITNLQVCVPNPDPEMTLLFFIRNHCIQVLKIVVYTFWSI